MQVEIQCDDANGIVFVGHQRHIDLPVTDRQGISGGTDVTEVLLHLSLRHSTNIKKTVVVAFDVELHNPLPMMVGMQHVYAFTGTPGTTDAALIVYTKGVLSAATPSFYVGYPSIGSPVQVSLSGDVAGGLRGLGVLRVASVSTAGLLTGYPDIAHRNNSTSTTTPQESVFRIQNRSRATPTSNHVEIGEVGTGSVRLISAECVDGEGNERMRVTPQGCVFNGAVNARLDVGEAVTVHSIVSGSDVYSVDATGNVFATSYTSLSDARMKCNITSLRRLQCLLDINRLKCYSYNFCVGDALLHHGLLADEVAKVIPSIVRGGVDGCVHHVAYDELIPFLVGAVQTLYNVLMWSLLLSACTVISSVVMWYSIPCRVTCA
jgi:hypothetical protein